MRTIKCWNLSTSGEKKSFFPITFPSSLPHLTFFLTNLVLLIRMRTTKCLSLSTFGTNTFIQLVNARPGLFLPIYTKCVTRFVVQPVNGRPSLQLVFAAWHFYNVDHLCVRNTAVPVFAAANDVTREFASPCLRCVNTE